ncbi:MAG: Bicarbonate transport ATP-binding protein CmpD, partial [Verrucomicrobiota bacterium]
LLDVHVMLLNDDVLASATCQWIEERHYNAEWAVAAQLDALTRATLQDEISSIWSEDKKTVVLITNDPDEGIYLADRIIPLTAGPGATLGPSFAVEIPRPRDRKSINHDPHFKQLRREVVEFMLNSKTERHTAVTKKMILPDIEPEDLNIPRTMTAWRKTPIRKREQQEESVEVKS